LVETINTNFSCPCCSGKIWSHNFFEGLYFENSTQYCGSAFCESCKKAFIAVRPKQEEQKDSINCWKQKELSSKRYAQFSISGLAHKQQIGSGVSAVLDYLQVMGTYITL